MKNAFKLWGEIALTGSKKAEAELKKLGDKLKETGEAMKTAGEGMSKWVTAPILAVGAGAIASASQVDVAQGSLQASLGLTAEQAEALNAKVQNLWKQGFGADMADVTNKVATVTRSIGDLNEADLKGIIGGIDVLEQQFGAGTQEQMNAVKTLMDQFGMSSTEAMDYLVTGFQNGLDYSGEFLDVISEYGTYFAEMGFSGEEFFNTLKSGSEGGAFQLDKVGDAMKEFSIRSKETGETTTGAFESLGMNSAEMISAFNAGGDEARQAFEKTVTGLQGIEDETKRNEIAVALFGTQYEDLGEEAFDAMNKASGAMGNVEGATRSASEAMRDNLGVDAQILFRELQTSLVPLGETLVKLAREYLPPLIEKITAVATWFSNLSAKSQGIILIFGAVLASIGPLLMVFGSIVGAIGPLIPVIAKVWSWFSKIKTLFTAVRGVMLLLSGPVGIVIAIIIALIAVGILIYKNWDSIKAWLIKIWNIVWTKAVEIFKKIRDAIVNKFTEIYSKVTSTVDKVKNAIVNKSTEIWNRVKTIFNNVKDAMMRPIETAKNKISGWINTITGFFSGLKNKMKISIPNFKLPHFSLKGKLDLVPPGLSVPKLGVNWYAKGGIFDGPSVVGVGESGPEAVLPLEGRYMKGLAETIARQMPGMGAGMGQIIVPLYLDGREIARATAPLMGRELEKNRQTRATFRSVTT